MLPALFILAFLIVTAALEYYVLARCYYKRSFTECVGIGSILSGILSGGVCAVLGTATGGVPPTFVDIFVNLVVGPMIVALIATALAVIPALITAAIYRRCRT
jgi:hypothetical protein